MRRPCNQPECIQTVAGILDPPKRASKLKQNLNGLSADYRGQAAMRDPQNLDTVPIRPASPAYANVSARVRAEAIECLNGRSTRLPRLVLLIKRATQSDGSKVVITTALGAPSAYSTVTLLARLRGWSTSHPRRIATSRASSCSGTVAVMGQNESRTLGT